MTINRTFLLVPFHPTADEGCHETRRVALGTTVVHESKSFHKATCFIDSAKHGASDRPYRVGPANFSRRKIGHAHDNSADSENVAGAPLPNVHAHFIFRFENGPGNQAFFLSMTKIQLKRVNHKLSQRTIGAPWTGRVPEASSGPQKSLIQHGLVKKKKKANSMNRRKFLLRGYKFKETKHDRSGKRPASTEAEKIDDRSTEADVNTFRRSIGLCVFFFSFFLRLSNNFRLAFLALNEASQAFT